MSFLSSIKNKASATLNQAPKQNSQQDDQSLATLLDRQQRAELSILISQTTEEMRNDLIKCFEEKALEPQLEKEAQEESGTIDLSKLTVSDPGTGAIVTQETETETGKDSRLSSSTDQDKEQSDEATSAEPTPEIRALRTAALVFFDVWAESVILRVGEVVNSRDQDKDKDDRRTKQLAHASEPEFQPTSRQQSVDRTLATVYPAIPTPLSRLSHLERSAILNAILLLLLSLESYRSHSRVLLLRLCTSLDISTGELTKMEKDTAFGLLSLAATSSRGVGMDASESTTKAQRASSSARKWKVGAAGVAGAALIGITGGLAAPLLAAGVGTLMGGLGLGATAAAGYLGALAGNAALVGGLFGAYGARMTSRTMDKYAREIEDFAFLPIVAASKEEATSQKLGRKDNEEEAQKRHRLRLTVGITGWLTEEAQVTLPWRILGDGGEPFALRWELEALQNLGNALRNFVTSEAWSQIRRELIKRTVLAALWSAMMAPLAIRKVIKLVESPFGIAKIRAIKAGEVLADALVSRVQGERPVSLIGMSLGARVVYACLLALARRQAFGLVENVVLMGAAVPSDREAWRAMRAVVSGRLVNVYSSQDYVLAFLYRTSSAQVGVAGIQKIEGVHGVENYDVSDEVGGHLKYMGRTGTVLEKVGWEDINEQEVLKMKNEVQIEESQQAG